MALSLFPASPCYLSDVCYFVQVKIQVWEPGVQWGCAGGLIKDCISLFIYQDPCLLVKLMRVDLCAFVFPVVEQEQDW